MPDIVTTLGADVSDLKGGLRQAAREYETHKREVARIDRKFGSDAAREFDRIIGRQRAMQNNQNAWTRLAGRSAATIKRNWQSITTVMTAAGTAMAGGLMLAERSVSRYAERYEFAARRVELASSRMAKGQDRFDRNMFLAYDTSNPGSVGSGILSGVSRVQDGIASFLQMMAPGRNRQSIASTNAQLDRAQQIDRVGVQNRNADRLRRADRARLLASQGRMGAAALATQEFEKMNALAQLGQANLSPQQRVEAIARLEASFGRMAERFERFDGSVAAERAYRSAGLRADDGSVAGGFRAREELIYADAEAAARSIVSGDGTPQTRSEALADLKLETERRLAALDREREMQTQIARVERERVGLIGRVGFDARRRMAASEAELARVRARGSMTDPRMLADEMARIDAVESAALAGIGREEDSSRRRGADLLETLRIERLRRRGNGSEADRAQIRMRFAAMERELTDAFGPGGGGMLSGLREEMKKALEDVGIDKSRASTDAVAPELIGGFAGVRARVGGRPRTETLLERIAENTEGGVVFVN